MLCKHGLMGWSLDTVATQADCTKGLILYHYRTKHGLLAATANRLNQEAVTRRLAALDRSGPGVLDHLFDAVVSEVESGWFMARMSLLATGLFPSPTAPLVAARLAVALGVDLENQQAIEAMLDGLSMQLVRGADVATVREAYDQLWLGLLAT